MSTQHEPKENNNILINKSTSTPQLPISRYRLIFKSLNSFKLPPYAGSSWRGAFGHALRNTHCMTNKPTCQGCTLQESCVYNYIFETPPPSNSLKMRKYPSVPHPFVLRIPENAKCDYKENENLEIELVLFGDANSYLVQIIKSLELAASNGIQQGKLSLRGVEQLIQQSDLQWRAIDINSESTNAMAPVMPAIPTCPKNVQISITHPMHLTAQGKRVKTQEFIFSNIFSPLLRRISMLQYFHGPSELEADFSTLMGLSKNVTINSTTLSEYRWHRYSSRQKQKMPMGGIVGEFNLKGEDIEHFWPYLYLGQYTHVGKGTSMGQGQYKISSLTSL